MPQRKHKKYVKKHGRSSAGTNRKGRQTERLLSEPAETYALESTLHLFAPEPTPFDVHGFVRHYYKTHDVSEAADHVTELKQRRAKTADSLKRHVHDHYSTFTENATQIANIENNMIKLGNSLGEYKACLKTMEKAASGNTHSKKVTGKADPSELSDPGKGVEYWEELVEDLRSDTCERKFGKAVASIEAAKDTEIQPSDKEKVKQYKGEFRECADNLIYMFTTEYRSNNLNQFERRRFLGYLTRLGATHQALEIFLEAHTLHCDQKIKADDMQSVGRQPILRHAFQLVAYLFGKHVNGNPNPGLSDKLYYL